jgi:hypothetical protein
VPLRISENREDCRRLGLNGPLDLNPLSSHNGNLVSSREQSPGSARGVQGRV